MRTAALLALIATTLACGADPPAACGAPGRSQACACVGGTQGAQECQPGGSWTVCACPDGGAMEAGVDAGRDAARETGADAPGGDAADSDDADPRCAHAPGRTFCMDPAVGGDGACFDTLTNRRHCGQCMSECPAGSECFMGRCALAADSGRD